MSFRRRPGLVEARKPQPVPLLPLRPSGSGPPAAFVAGRGQSWERTACSFSAMVGPELLVG